MELLERGPILDQLHSLLNDAERGRGRLVAIAGEAGIGKSVLIRHFCESVSNRADVFIGSCDPLSTPTPFGPVLDIAPELGGDFEDLLREPSPVRRLGNALLARRGVRPRVLVFEDMHWADDATLDLLRFLSRRLIATRDLLIATYRDDEVGPRHPLRIALGDVANAGVVRIILAPLTIDAVRRLSAGSEVDVHELHRRTGGNPFFVREVLAALSAGVPVTVRDALLARLARLAPTVRVVLEAAAISGPRIDPRLLEQVTSQTQESLDACVEAGLLVSERDQLTFRHELWREAVLDTVPAHRQVALHRVILAALVQTDAPDDRLARFAHHAEGARDAAAVLKYASAAARYASQLGAHREAAAQYARALQWAHQLDARQRALLLRARSAECFLIDQAPEASEARRAAIGIWHELGDREQEGDDLCWLSRAYWLAGNNAETEHAIERALQLLEHGRPGLPLARALSTYAQLRFLSCDYEKAIAAAERAITIAGTSTEHNASDVMLHAALSRDASRWAMDDDAGRSQLEATLQACLSRGLHEPSARAFSLLTGAWSGRYVLQSAEKSIEQGLAYLQEHDLDLYRHTLISSKCSLLLRRGRWTEALELANLIDASPEYAAVHRISALTVIGLVRGRRGEPGAWQPLDTALELADRIGEPHRVVPVRTARAEVAWLAHDLVRAADEARPAFELAIQNPFRWYAVEPAVWLWRAGQLPAVHPDLPAPD